LVNNIKRNVLFLAGDTKLFTVNHNLKTMKKLIAVFLLSMFTIGSFASAIPGIQQDTTKHKNTKKDTVKRDTTKKPPAQHR